MSVFASAISMLETRVWRKRHSANISRIRSRRPWRLASSSAVPKPYQPGTIWRDWVQPKTHGIARSPSMPAVLPPRRRRPRAYVELAELLDGGAAEEVIDEAFPLDQAAVLLVGGAR